jgi:hypothetical protein
MQRELILYKKKIDLVLNMATDMTKERLSQFPIYGIYVHAHDQIKFIAEILQKEKIPTQQDKDFVDIALMSVKELDTTEPEYSDVLCELSYLFKGLRQT